MSRTVYSTTPERRIRERSYTAADKSNPLNPARSTEAGKPDRERSPSGPSLETRRRALLALRARLRGNVTQTSEAALAGSIEIASASPDTVERASETIEQDVALSLLGSVAHTLEQIEAALQRIEDGSYGRCATCETKIPAARLDAIPYATCCVECAARQERAA